MPSYCRPLVILRDAFVARLCEGGGSARYVILPGCKSAFNLDPVSASNIGPPRSSVRWSLPVLEVVRLAREYGVFVAVAARDIYVRENALRKWIRTYEEVLAHTFPRPGQQKPDDGEIQMLNREIRRSLGR
jgi:hypothetical protein